jgi:hypothetical protein
MSSELGEATVRCAGDRGHHLVCFPASDQKRDRALRIGFLIASHLARLWVGKVLKISFRDLNNIGSGEIQHIPEEGCHSERSKLTVLGMIICRRHSPTSAPSRARQTSASDQSRMIGGSDPRKNG